METMTCPCSPLIPFPTQHEESSYLLWPPQLAPHHGNADISDMCHGDPPTDDRRQDHDQFLAMMMVQDAGGGMHQVGFSDVDRPLAAGCEEERLLGQEGGGNNLVEAVLQEELMVVMEESSLADLLMAGAMAVEAGDSVRASAIMAKIDGILAGIADGRCDVAAGSSFDHLACYFAGALRSRIGAVVRTECRSAAPPPAVRPAKRLPAYQLLQELSPFVMFAHFTGNQAILEATVDDAGVHVVDLNVGDGVQWSSFMSDLASSRHGSKPFRLTALTTGAGAGAHRTGAPARWLCEFAESLGLPFRYDEVENLHELTKSCCSTGVGSSSSVIVSCDATSMYHTSVSTSQVLSLLLHSVKILRPKLVTLAEDELFLTGRAPPLLAAGASFAEFFREEVRHFAAVQESMASCFRGGGYEACMRLVEEEILRPRIEGSAAGRHESMTGGAGADVVTTGFSGVGFMARRVSDFNIAQAKMLAGLFSRGFGVLHDKERLALSWKERPLTSVSIWSPV